VLAAALVALAMTSVSLSAHRRDEYLQAARLAIAPSRIELQIDLTPGITVADAVIGEIDRDRDGRLSADEQRAYVLTVLGAIDLQIDGRPLQIEPIGSTFPDLDAVRRGEGTIRFESAVNLPRLSRGEHHLFFRNAHRLGGSVYLANALVPRNDRVKVVAQRRDPEQRDLTIDYVLDGTPAISTLWLLFGGLAVAALMYSSRRAIRGPADRDNPRPYSDRNASAGSIREARRAGM
jgi:hypothetical protein